MNDLEKEKTMTIKELAEVLNLDVRTIQLKVKELFPDIVKEKVKTYLNEYQVTSIKLACEKKFAVKTELEKELLIHQAMIYQQEKINILQLEIEKMKPKAVSYDIFISSKGLHDMDEVAKLFGTGRNRLFKLLRDNNYLKTNNVPYQQFIDAGYFEVKEKVIPTGEAIPVTKVTSSGIVATENIIRRIGNDL